MEMKKMVISFEIKSETGMTRQGGAKETRWLDSSI